MAYFLVTSLMDEGIYWHDFVVVEADSERAIAAHMLRHPHHWEPFLRNSLP